MDIIYPNNEQWNFADGLIERLQAAGFQAFLVGGCVRDVLLGIEPGDYDIAVSAKPEEVLELFSSADKIGIKYGVLKIKEGGNSAQIATFRKDHPTGDGRRPQRVYFSTLEEDAKRRDFTINAMYLNPVSGELYDPFGGRADLQNKILRFVGEPRVRIKEDYLRILRAVRFASRFNLQIEKEALKALVKNSSLVKEISVQRVTDEITRSFSHENKVYAIELLHLLNILPIFWDIFKNAPNLVERCKDNLANCRSDKPEEVWTAFYSTFKEAEESRDWIKENMSGLNFSRHLKKTVLANL